MTKPKLTPTDELNGLIAGIALALIKKGVLTKAEIDAAKATTLQALRESE